MIPITLSLEDLEGGTDYTTLQKVESITRGVVGFGAAAETYLAQRGYGTDGRDATALRKIGLLRRCAEEMTEKAIDRVRNGEFDEDWKREGKPPLDSTQESYTESDRMADNLSFHAVNTRIDFIFSNLSWLLNHIEESKELTAAYDNDAAAQIAKLTPRAYGNAVRQQTRELAEAFGEWKTELDAGIAEYEGRLDTSARELLEGARDLVDYMARALPTIDMKLDAARVR